MTAEIIFDEAEEDTSFWTRDIGMIRRKAAPRKKDESPAFKKVKIDEEAVSELASLKKLFEKQTEFVTKLTPHIDRINSVFADALLRMEQDAVDDVYCIGEMRKEFANIRTELSKYLPKMEVKVDNKTELDRIATYTFAPGELQNW